MAFVNRILRGLVRNTVTVSYAIITNWNLGTSKLLILIHRKNGIFLRPKQGVAELVSPDILLFHESKTVSKHLNLTFAIVQL